MLGNLINFTDPSKNSFYFSFIIVIIVIILLIQLIIEILKESEGKLNHNKILSLYGSSPEDHECPLDIKNQKNILISRYLLVFAITRSTMWAKIPYLYALFMIVHKFSFAEIGFLFLIFSIGQLILGPIIFTLTYKFGCKLYCHIYNFSTIIEILLLIQGKRPLAYIAIIIASGFDIRFLNSIFETWLLSESEKIFRNFRAEEKLFRENLFLKSNKYGAFISIITCIICAFIYTYFGIIYPFYLSILLSLSSSIVIQIFLEEKNLLRLQSYLNNYRILEIRYKFKKMDILCIGLIEGLVMACLNIYLFSWTPILKQSTPGGMNVGFIFMAMALSFLMGTKMYELLIDYWIFDYHTSITINLLLQGLILFLVYCINNFLTRMIFLSLFNALFGFYSPLIDLIKSNILNEEYKSTMMSLFSILTNIYVIVIFLHLNYMNCFTLALISSIICLIAFLIGMILVIYQFLIYSEENIEYEDFIRLLHEGN